MLLLIIIPIDWIWNHQYLVAVFAVIVSTIGLGVNLSSSFPVFYTKGHPQ